MTASIKTFEEFREYVFELKSDAKEYLVESLEDLSEFNRGRSIGYVDACNDILETLRQILKYGECGKEMCHSECSELK